MVAQAELTRCDTIQEEALDGLARALIAEGKPRGNPFEPFGVPPASALLRLPSAEVAKSVHELVTTVQRTKGESAATLKAAKTADDAAAAVERALVPIAQLQEKVRDARRRRDAVAQSWELALSALRYDCRAAAKEGAPVLYTTLFPTVVRKAAKKPAKAPSDATPATASPTT